MINKNNKTDKKSQKNVINSSLTNPYFNTSTEEAIISLKKVRKLGLKSFSLSGNITSLKRNDLISFESSLERDYIKLLEFSENVNQYFEQPIKIYYKIDNKKKYYVPDFYVKYIDDRPDEIIEIKYSETLTKNKKKFKEKFRAASTFCTDNNIIFRILTEKDIRNDYLFNSSFLLSYKFGKSPIDFRDVEIIEDILKSCSYSTPNNILKRLNTNIEYRAQFLYVLWYMIATNLVKTDLNLKLTMNSKIWISDYE